MLRHCISVGVHVESLTISNEEERIEGRRVVCSCSTSEIKTAFSVMRQRGNERSNGLCQWLINLTQIVWDSLSQWPRGLKHELSSLARTLGSWTFILCVSRGLVTGWSPVRGVLATVYRSRNWKGPTKGSRDVCCVGYAVLLRGFI
jgi:hypothetical protein